MTFKKVTHVIFDMDGLLIESESIYNKIVADIGREYGKPYDLPLRVKVLGKTEIDTAKTIVNDMELPITTEEFLDDYRLRVEKELTNPELMPGAFELVNHLYKHNIPIAVATSSSESAVCVKTQNHIDFFSLFDHIVCGGSDPEVKQGKPAPDIFQICASRFADNPSAEQCLVLEDAPNGIKGAIAAGMQSVLVPNDEISEELRKNASLVVKSLHDFKPELFGLPPFNSL